MHRSISRRRRLGHSHHRLVNSGWWCESSPHSNEEPYQYHLLRGRGDLRCYHGHCLQLEARCRSRVRTILRRQLLYRIRPFLERTDGWDVQPDLWRQCWHQRFECCPRRCCRSHAVSTAIWYAVASLTSSSFVKILVIEIFSSVLGLFGLIIGLLLSGKADPFQ